MFLKRQELKEASRELGHLSDTPSGEPGDVSSSKIPTRSHPKFHQQDVAGRSPLAWKPEGNLRTITHLPGRLCDGEPEPETP